MEAGGQHSPVAPVAGSGEAAPPQQQEAAAPSAAAAGCSVRCFSETTPSDGRLDFQIIDLGRQLYVWVALGGAKMGNLSFGIASPAQGGAPAVAVLLRGKAGPSGEALAQRLAMRLKRPVLCSCNIPQDMDMLQIVAERRLLRELLGGGGGGGAAVAPVAAALIPPGGSGGGMLAAS